ncbi:MAG: hypothetical protein QME45_04330 [Clostridiales bacterium]|nr:hypothetical protein [Clostridiales bacterium]
MVKALDLTGEKFNRLTVIKRVKNDKWGSARWLCECECGNEAIVRTNDLRRGHTKSCGCYNMEKVIERCPDTSRHMQSNTKLYASWVSMKDRCYNKNNKSYLDYGGRGIKICDEWLIPDNFFNWALNNGYSEELTIDRVNVNGNYEPNNCRWISMKRQIRNRRNTLKVEYQGKFITLGELSEKTNIPYATLHWRYKQGFSTDRLVEPVNPHKKYEKRNIKVK